MLVFYAAVAVYWMATGYLQSDLTFIAGLGVLFLSTVVRQPGVGSWRFAFWAVLCVGLGLAIPARTFHFMALVFAAGFVFENGKGKINEAPVLTALLLTAVVKTMSIVLGFAIRLELSKNAAAALRYLGMDAVAEGNVIRLKEQYFSVDPACMGLQMVDVSFLFCSNGALAGIYPGLFSWRRSQVSVF
jgi:exosortase N